MSARGIDGVHVVVDPSPGLDNARPAIVEARSGATTPIRFTTSSPGPIVVVGLLPGGLDTAG